LRSITPKLLHSSPPNDESVKPIDDAVVTLPRGCALLFVSTLLRSYHLSPSAQAPQRFKARLSPVPVDLAMLATIAGTGSATAELSGARLSITGTFTGLRSPATVARLHKAPMGLRGPAVSDLTVAKATSGTVSGTLTLTAAQLEDLRRSRYYLQIHSEKAPEGNLRGWLVPEEHP
jgi:hypothetical protein